MFYGHNLAIFLIDRAEMLLWELRRLLLPFSIFLGPKKGRGPAGTPMNLEPQKPTKNLTHLVDLGPPPPPLNDQGEKYKKSTISLLGSWYSAILIPKIRYVLEWGRALF